MLPHFCLPACNIISIICLAFLLFNVNMPSAEALVLQVPVQIFSSVVYMHSRDSNSKLPTNQYRVVQRELSSKDESSLKNNLKGYSGDGYYIDLNIGTPVQKMKILIDTGSSNFAVAATQDPNVSQYFHQDKSSTFESLNTQVYVPYTEGEWTGDLGTDIVSLTHSPNISARVNIACITKSKNFFIPEAEWQGILGLGYKGLARPSSSITPFWDSVLESHPDLEDIFSMSLCGSAFVHTSGELLRQGSLIFGGIVPSLSRTPLLYAPITRELYYEVVLTDIAVANKPLGLHCKEYNFDKTMVDSGTTNIRLPTKVFNELVAVIHKDVKADGNVLGITSSFYDGESILCFADLATLFVSFPVISFELMMSENSSFKLHLSPQHYLRPVDMILEEIGSCVKFGFSPSNGGTVLGAVLMEAFYVVFDRKAKQIGFGQTACPLPDPRHPILNVTITGPFYKNKNNSVCIYKKSSADDQSFLVVSYVMIGLSVIVFIPLVLLFALWIRGRMKDMENEDMSETQNVLAD
ncbi:beta-secretase 1-like [Biomphalaria glabrata]|uniref:Beta-secretase 1-like n=1 Tax=Biomphalaria glabrata TaxID=6526 RepID=A0A9W2YYJ5_BIOGL|nr:beta-secretase 1-like [Biomphalaria glabrata]